ncbi:hypothetical protein QN277_011330 [Acacia crassicarpa]|uniref:Uncharacterized protein n=1 Tax=Acacia crassicarpa TaxID=499986 RepID=A0AAE1MYJ0_9FABA|nr:hypothetical protein QN277_011330 [Acacia crassicarpa]
MAELSLPQNSNAITETGSYICRGGIGIDEETLADYLNYVLLYYFALNSRVINCLHACNEVNHHKLYSIINYI